LILQGKVEMLACYIASMQVSFPLVLFVIPACLESFLGRIADKPQWQKE